jgi:hypothetical protein
MSAASTEVEITLPSGRPLNKGALYRATTSTVFLGSAMTLLTWPINQITPGSGPDFSWMAAMYMAHSEGIEFGRDLVFTYGPLGFLETPVLYDQTLWIVAFTFQLLLHAGLAISLLCVARRRLPLPVAAAACYCLLISGRFGAAATLLAFLWCFAALNEGQSARTRQIAVPAVALLAAVELLGKHNYGITVLGLALVCALALPERRGAVLKVAASAGGGFLLLWLVTGQGFPALLDFIPREAELISGYSSAMPVDTVDQGWRLPAAVVCIVLLLVGALIAVWRSSTASQLGSLALVALFCFGSFKQGFVRQGYGNTPEFFLLIASAGLVVASRLPRLRFGAAAGALLLPLLVVALIVTPGASIWRTLTPQTHVEALAYDLRALVSHERRTELVREEREFMRGTYRLPASDRRPADSDRTLGGSCRLGVRPALESAADLAGLCRLFARPRPPQCWRAEHGHGTAAHTAPPAA